MNSGLSCLITTVTYEYIFRTILLEKIVASSFGFAVDFIPTQSPFEVLAHFQKSLNHQKKNVFSIRKYLPKFALEKTIEEYRKFIAAFFF